MAGQTHVPHTWHIWNINSDLGRTSGATRLDRHRGISSLQHPVPSRDGNSGEGEGEEMEVEWVDGAVEAESSTLKPWMYQL